MLAAATIAAAATPNAPECAIGPSRPSVSYASLSQKGLGDSAGAAVTWCRGLPAPAQKKRRARSGPGEFFDRLSCVLLDRGGLLLRSHLDDAVGGALVDQQIAFLGRPPVPP